MKRFINEDQVAYARHLDREHGRESALAYLRIVTREDYLPGKNATASKEADRTHQCVYKLNCCEARGL